jgi:hypothetical protein
MSAHGANESDRRRSSTIDPTPEDVAAGASLPREPAPEKLESRADDAPPATPPAVQKLIDAQGRAPHGGVALSVGVNAAVGPGVAVGGEVSVGVVVDLAEPEISLFLSKGAGLKSRTP